MKSNVRIIDMSDAKRISLHDLRYDHIPRRPNGKPVSPSTVWRWINKGLAGVDGQRVRLAANYFGTQPFFLIEDIEHFVEQTTNARRMKFKQINLDRGIEAELKENGLR